MTATDPFVRALTGDPEQQTITLTRLYRAPIDDVWNAVVDPERVARWYGTIQGDPPTAPGDAFAVDLGGGMLRRARLESCAAPTTLQYTWWSGDDDPGLVRLHLEAVGPEETALTVRHDRLRPHRLLGYGGGWEQALVGLAAVVGAPDTDTTAADRREQRWELLRTHPLALEVDLDAPLEDVWAAWTSAEALASWWWIHWDDVVVEADVRVDGRYRFATAAHGMAVAGRFLEVVDRQRLAFTWEWTDADGTSRDEAVQVDVAARPGGGTTLAVRHTGPWADDAPVASYRAGWTFVLGELAGILA